MSIKNFFMVVLVLIIALPVLVCISSYNKYRDAIETISIEEMVAEIKSDDSYYSIEDIPQFYIDAVVCVISW